MSVHEYENQKARTCLVIMHTGGGDTDVRYTTLLTQALEAGLFKTTYLRYALTVLLGLFGLASSVYLLYTVPSPWLQILNGVWFGFWSVQLGMVGHDLSHGEVFQTKKVNSFFAIFMWCFVAGLSERRWYTKHNAHHESPNHEGHDPDIDIPFVLDVLQVSSRSAFFRQYILPYQHIVFWITLPFIYFWNVAYSVLHLFTKIDTRSIIEFFLIALHFCILFSVTFLLLPVISSLVFLCAYFLTVGVYMSIAFAPNHKSEKIIDSTCHYSWISQITSTRNLYADPLTFFLLGGLNFQIEHHLFPVMSRFQYFKVQTLIKDFCKEHNITYSETSWLRSMQDIHLLLKEAQQIPVT